MISNFMTQLVAISETKSHQSQKSENTKKKIIESALKLLETKGYSKANLADIAKGAKITVGALQHHFPNKNALLEVLVSEVLAPLDISSYTNVWPDVEESIEDRAKFFVDQVWDKIYGNKRYIATWSLFLGCRSNKKLFDAIKQHRIQNDPIFNKNFLKYFPEISQNAPTPDYFASYVYSTLRGMAIMQIFTPLEEEIDAQLKIITKTIIFYSKNKF